MSKFNEVIIQPRLAAATGWFLHCCLYGKLKQKMDGFLPQSIRHGFVTSFQHTGRPTIIAPQYTKRASQQYSITFPLEMNWVSPSFSARARLFYLHRYINSRGAGFQPQIRRFTFGTNPLRRHMLSHNNHIWVWVDGKFLQPKIPTRKETLK